MRMRTEVPLGGAAGGGTHGSLLRIGLVKSATDLFPCLAIAKRMALAGGKLPPGEMQT